MENRAQPITEDWLSAYGFRWHQVDRQPCKQWVLWLGCAIEEGMTSLEDIGVEVSRTLSKDDNHWNCWLRRDTASKYCRFIHVRRLTWQEELIRLIEGLTGLDLNPNNHLYGAMYAESDAQRIREIEKRLDHQLLFARPRWSDIERDETRGRALPEHTEEAVKRGGAK